MVLLLFLGLCLSACVHPGVPMPPASSVPKNQDLLEQLMLTQYFTRGQPVFIRVDPLGRAVYFLRSPARSAERALYRFDASTRETERMLTAAELLGGAEEEALSAAEKARRERLRLSARGIVSFRLSPDGRHMLIPLSGRLFLVALDGGARRELSPGATQPAIDARFSPDSRSIALARGRDLHVIDIETGEERRLSQARTATESYGQAEFVAQEEMSRMEGYWWSPDGAFLAVQHTETAGMEVFHIADPLQPMQTPTPWPYPRPGEANAIVRLAIFPVGGGSAVWVNWDRERYPYLAAVRWSAGAPLTLLVQDRRQQQELLLTVDPDTGRSQTILVEQDVTWVNLDDTMPHWLAGGESFLWSTEREGAWQLERRSASGELEAVLTEPSLGYRRLLHVDQAKGVVWVNASAEPTCMQVYQVPLDPAAGAPQAMSTGSGWHGAIFGGVGGLWVETATRLQGAVLPTVRRDDEVLGSLASVAESSPVALNLEMVVVGERDYRALIIRPHDFDPSRRYPVLLHVYGGPHAQMVTHTPRRYLLDQWYADHGYVVVSLDGRGTPGRGRAWERAIHHDLITVPLQDQVDGLQAILARYPELDPQRVGVYGWSFGGYFSIHAVMQRPDVFTAGVAGAPVTDWMFYDTHYTERYMGLPSENVEGYRHGSALTHAPDLDRPLLILHGTDDDNVYFTHALQLSDALFRAGRPFDFLPLTGFTHMVADPVVSRRLHERILGHFDQHLVSP